MGDKVMIRKYKAKDYEGACELLYQMQMEPWIPSYKRIIDGTATLPTLLQGHKYSVKVLVPLPLKWRDICHRT